MILDEDFTERFNRKVWKCIKLYEDGNDPQIIDGKWIKKKDSYYFKEKDGTKHSYQFLKKFITGNDKDNIDSVTFYPFEDNNYCVSGWIAGQSQFENMQKVNEKYKPNTVLSQIAFEHCGIELKESIRITPKLRDTDREHILKTMRENFINEMIGLIDGSKPYLGNSIIYLDDLRNDYLIS